MIYLASPYTHKDPAVMEARYLAVCDSLVELMQEGKVVVSPIVHCHHLAVNYALPRSHDFWLAYDLAILDRCDELFVLKLPGWGDSKGVTAEIAHAKLKNIPIKYID